MNVKMIETKLAIVSVFKILERRSGDYIFKKREAKLKNRTKKTDDAKTRDTSFPM
jgi:hypothetical protein